ncbi:HipA domain-containing protein [Pseudomonas putida]|uniref:type II toxin-antitoxin system HipA family toxin n=1 Tax=Pseudomonas putida group TaxID=136845 RepID=UPI0018AC5D0F|nr:MULTISPECIES: HipA domain-containing protein [Pseudomonas putida group]MBF8766439.1 HipA domain-containing protein [Pseudomonas putida]MEC4023681.1 HipA domain-containing protein [Pseudomonas fulva]
MPLRLVIQAFYEGTWTDAATLTVENPAHVAEGASLVAYDDDYIIANFDRMEDRCERALSVNLPLNWEHHHGKGYPAFLYDIIPSGAAKNALESRYARSKPEGMEMGLYLLKRFAPAPVGHLRIKESIEDLKPGRQEAFARLEVVNRTNEFLEYAFETGAALGGATGANGQAPKLLMTQAHDGALYADAMLADDQARHHWLIKFARNRGSERDNDILRTEFHYYNAVAALGLDTVPTEGLMLEEAVKPSLWMPRFDRRVVHGVVERVPLESVYSICGITGYGQVMAHTEVVRRLVELWTHNGQRDEVEDLVFEYARRDLLNRILGNTDNHGRNISIIREGGKFRLAPIYDLAPMILDEEGVTRTTKWAAERKGSSNWRDNCAELAGYTDPDVLLQRLMDAADGFRALPDLLTGVPESVRNAAPLPVNDLDKRLAQWGLR